MKTVNEAIVIKHAFPDSQFSTSENMGTDVTRVLGHRSLLILTLLKFLP